LILILAFLLIAVILSLFLYFRFSRETANAPLTTSSSGTKAGGWEEQEIPSLPDIALEINTEQELTTFHGTPLVFTVRLANQRAANAEAENRSRENSIAVIEDNVVKGKIRADKAKIMLSHFRRTRQVKPVRLGTPDQGWDQFVHFEYRREGENFQRADWVLKSAVAPESKSIALDANNRVDSSYAMTPETAASLPVERLEIVAVLEVPPGGTLPLEHWRGRAVSDPVKLIIRLLPVNLSPEDRGTQNLQTADYFAILKDWPGTLASAQKAIAANPKMIRAYMRLGDAKEAQGDLKGARDAFDTAKRLFNEQYPDSYEYPLFLIQKIADLDARLK
jgi:hypothetical protein